MSQMDEKTQKRSAICSSLLKTLQKIIHWTQRMIKKLFSLRKNLFTMTAFLTFAFRSK